jgi:hypothetical protein
MIASGVLPEEGCSDQGTDKRQKKETREDKERISSAKT